VVGAGLSRNVSKSMPLMHDLLPTATNVIRARSEKLMDRLRRLGDDLELWMSFLAQSPPWLDEADGLYNQSMFVRTASALGREVYRRQNYALQEKPEQWLLDLVTKWQMGRPNPRQRCSCVINPLDDPIGRSKG
jgi:hypothetical protein